MLTRIDSVTPWRLNYSDEAPASKISPTSSATRPRSSGSITANGHRPGRAALIPSWTRLSWAQIGHRRKKPPYLIDTAADIWWGEGDLNPHEIAPASPSSQNCVFHRVSQRPKSLIL